MTKSEKPTRYLVYCRTSSEQQDVENSISGQRSAAQDYVKLHGGVIVGYYIDEAKTGRVDRRPGFQKVIQWAPPTNLPATPSSFGNSTGSLETSET